MSDPALLPASEAISNPKPSYLSLMAVPQDIYNTQACDSGLVRHRQYTSQFCKAHKVTMVTAIV